MTTFLRSIRSDLLEKRLWPLAVVLLLALVVITAVSLGSATPSTSPPAASGSTANGSLASSPHPAIVATPAGSDTAAAVAATTGGASVQRSGHAHNPFALQPGVRLNPVSAATAVKTSSASGAGGATTSPLTKAATTTTTRTTPSTTSPSTSTHSTGAPSTSSPSKGTAIATKPAYHVTLRFGFLGQLQTYNDVTKLTPLPSAQYALLSFLGVRANGRTVSFALLHAAIPSGTGRCRPSPTDCRQLDMRQGQTETLYYVTAALTVVALRLEVSAVVADRSATAIPAAAANGRQSLAGRAVLRRAAPTVLRDISYSKLTGTLVALHHGRGSGGGGA